MTSKLKIISILILFISCYTFASGITTYPNTQLPKLISGDTNKLIINPANLNGVSYNRVDSFNVSSPLLLMNSSELVDQYSGNNEIKTIIIHANSVDLSSEVSLASIQTSTNLLILVNSEQGSIACTNCKFSGFPRVALATANTSNPLNSNMDTPAVLTNLAGSNITIESLQAPDALSVEFYSNTISHSGRTSSAYNIQRSGSEYVAGKGNELALSAGFNFFVGPLSISFNEHEIIDANETVSSVNSFGGVIQGAGISITSARPIEISSGATFSTLSDVLTSGHVGEEYFVPTGNIDLVTTSSKSSFGGITNNGSLLSDTSVNITGAYGFINNGYISANKSEMTAKNNFKNSGTIDISDEFELAALYIENRGHLNAATGNLQAEKALFNHFGGHILGNDIRLETEYFVNGSRKSSAPQISIPIKLQISEGLNDAADYGIYNDNDLKSLNVENAAVVAHIAANKLFISAKIIENINPYFKVRKEEKNEIWNGKVELDYAKSRQVSIQSQSILRLYADDYIVNSSAILGLQSDGEFIVNTPNFKNERYRVDTKGYIFTRDTQDGTNLKNSTLKAREYEAHVDAIAPMAVLYSFGDFHLSPVTANTGTTNLTNLMSFMQVQGTSNFHNGKLSSIAILASSQTQSGVSSYCMINGCPESKFEDNYVQTTFTSFLGDVRGLSTDIVADTKLVVDKLIQGYVDLYIEKFVQAKKDEFTAAGNVLKLDGRDMFWANSAKVVDGQTEYIDITITTCFVDYDKDAGHIMPICGGNTYSKSIDSIVSEATEGNNIPGTTHTDAEIRILANIYLSQFNYKSSERFTSGVDGGFEGFVEGYWGNKIYSYKTYTQAGGGTGIELEYSKRFYETSKLIYPKTVAGAKLADADLLEIVSSKKISYDTLKAAKPPVPVINNHSFTSSSKQLTLSIVPVIAANASYEFDISGINGPLTTSTHTSKTYTLSKTSTVSFKAKSCLNMGSEKICSNYSPSKQATHTVSNSGGDDDITPPPCRPGEICQLPVEIYNKGTGQ